MAQQPAGLSPSAGAAEHLAAFDQIWTTVRDRHWDPTLNGVDWEGARRELRPEVEAAATDTEARAAMLALIDRLGQTHFNVIPGDLYELLGRRRPRRSRATRASASGSSTAAPSSRRSSRDRRRPRAGVRPGWEIVRIGDIDVRPRLERLVNELPETLLKPADLATAVEATAEGTGG